MTLNKRIYLSPPHMTGKEIIFIDDAFQSNWIAPLGPNVDIFEKEMAEYVGVKGAVALSSGTAGIHIALKLLNISKGDLVFCSSLTFVASANPILYEGAVPVFIDSEPETWNMSPVALEEAFEDAVKKNKLPKAVIVVNLYGQSSDMDRIETICKIYDVPLIEDAAESLGASYNKKKSGSCGKFGVFSFNGNKIITTSGGGMLVSNDEAALEKARFLATQARDKAVHYEHSELGYNYRLSNVLAGIGRAQLSMLDERVKQRRKIFQRYSEGLKEVEGISFMPEPPNYFSTRWLTALTIQNKYVKRNDIINRLEQHNIESRPVWKPLHLQPLFKDFDYYPHNEGISEVLFRDGICLPSGTNMTDTDQDLVIEILIDFYKSKIY